MHELKITCLNLLAWTFFNQVLARTKANEIWLKLHDTTPDLHITADIITAGFVRTGSDVPSLPVMSLKMKK